MIACCGNGRVQRANDGAKVVDESFAGANDEKKARCKPPHCVIAEEAAGLFVEKPGFLAGGFEGG